MQAPSTAWRAGRGPGLARRAGQLEGLARRCCSVPSGRRTGVLPRTDVTARAAHGLLGKPGHANLGRPLLPGPQVAHRGWHGSWAWASTADRYQARVSGRGQDWCPTVSRRDGNMRPQGLRGPARGWCPRQSTRQGERWTSGRAWDGPVGAAAAAVRGREAHAWCGTVGGQEAVGPEGPGRLWGCATGQATGQTKTPMRGKPPKSCR